jgi:hypothetical protein
MFNENTSVISANIVADCVNYIFEDDEENQQIKITIQQVKEIDLKNVKAVVFYEIDSNGNKVTYLAKNFTNGITEDTIPNFYIYPVFTD